MNRKSAGSALLAVQPRVCTCPALSGEETVAFAWNVILDVVRISTRPGAFIKPLTSAQAFDDARGNRTFFVILGEMPQGFPLSWGTITEAIREENSRI
jgi:hypothetical protein